MSRRQFQKEEHMVRAKRILCLIEKESQLRHPNHRVNLHRLKPRTHLRNDCVCKENNHKLRVTEENRHKHRIVEVQ